ncbi:MAG: Ig-like domain-containing protein [bacterium]|nr:Ig-like domain-containing protein [bacterium]
MQIKSRSTILATLMAGLLLLVFGCEGPEGAAGRDATLPDTQAPSIDWIRPFGGELVTPRDTLEVTAYDNSSVDSVHFYLDGMPLIKGMIVGTHSNRYRAVWQSAWASNGYHTLAARAFDPTGNFTYTPTILVNTLATGIDTLQNFSGTYANPPQGWSLPDLVNLSTEYAVELRSTNQCSLKTIQFVVRLVSTQTEFDTLMFYLYDKVNNLPNQRIDSLVILPDSLSNTGFSSLTLQRLLSANTSYYFAIAAPLTMEPIAIITDQAVRNPNRQELELRTEWISLTENNIMLRAIVDILE